jgi:hypothetical protein
MSAGDGRVVESHRPAFYMLAAVALPDDMPESTEHLVYFVADLERQIPDTLLTLPRGHSNICNG